MGAMREREGERETGRERKGGRTERERVKYTDTNTHIDR